MEVTRYFLSEESISRADLQQNLEHVVIATFNLLLFLQILLRAVAARVWGTILFILHIGILVYHYTLADPEQWLYLSTLGRMQVVARLIFLSVAIMLLNHSPNKDALRGQ